MPVPEIPESLRAALRSITSRITTSAADFGAYEPDAWVYGIAVGWDCEEDHDHDDICGGTAAMAELVEHHGWDDAAVARLRSYRSAFAAAVAEVPPAEPAGNVIYCCGCQRIWVERSVSIVALASGVVPADCACTCTDPADPLYETWMVNPDEDDLPEGVWVS